MTNALPARLLVVWHLLDLARTHVGHSHGPFHGLATGATLCDDRGLGPSAVFLQWRWLVAVELGKSKAESEHPEKKTSFHNHLGILQVNVRNPEKGRCEF